jgi:molybdate transport system substrate-binding protein
MRRSSRFARLLPLAAVWILCAGFAGGTPQSKTDLTVSAAISLKDSLDEIAQLYRAKHADVAIHFNLGGSGTLQRQVEQGAPVDIFISASPDQMDALESKGLILPGTRKDMVKNSVVLIVPKDKEGISGFEDLAKPEAKTIAAGEPQTVPAGKYAQQVLMHFGLYDKVKSKLVLGKDVREVLAYVATGNADAGIVYVTDAKISQQVKIVATAPDDSHSPIIYPLAVIKDSKNTAAAKEFAAFLLSPAARNVFKKYGFQ